MKTTDSFIYHHNFQDYSIKLYLDVEYYRPRFGIEDSDDCSELEILKATAMENVGDYQEGNVFDTEILDYDDVIDFYLNQK